MSSNTLLLVEDDSNDVILIRRAFKKAQFAIRIQMVHDGEQAINYLCGDDQYADRIAYPLPNLILLDLKLPRKSGFEVLQWVRQQPLLRRIPVIVLTSSKESPDINQAYDLGANSYLVKPVEFNSLVDLITTLNLYWVFLNENPEVWSKA